MKNREEIIINNIINDTEVIKPKIKYQYKNDTIEVLFVENSEYNEYLLEQNISNKYIFNYKGKNHLLIVNSNSYNKYKSLFSEVVIKSTLRLFVNRRKTRIRFKIILLTFSLIVVVLNYLILKYNNFSKVFFIPVISLIVIAISFVYISKIIEQLYVKDQERTKNELKKLLPNLDKDIKEDKNKKGTNPFS